MKRGVALAGVGLAIGIATQLLQGILPGALNWLANALSGWLVAAFVAGSVLPRPRTAALGAVILLLAALAGYYATVQVRFGYGGSQSSYLFWGIGAVAGGVVFGAAGWWWRHGSARIRALSIGLLAALLVCEGIYFLAILPDPAVGGAAIAIGLAIPAVFGRTWRDRAAGYAGILPGVALGVAGYAATLVLYGLVTGA